MLKNARPIRQYTFLLFTIPALVLYTLFFFYPILSGIFYSLTDWNGITRKFNIIGLRNYLTIFEDYRLVNSLVFTLQYVSILVAVVNLIALTLALILNQLGRFSTTARAIFFFPAVLPLITVGLIWDQIFYRALPLFGKMVGIGFLSQNILSDPDTAIFGILFVHTWQGVAVPTVLFLAGLQTVPMDLIEASILDGTNSRQRFRHIVLPYLLPILSMTLVLILKQGITVFDYIKAMTEGGPGRATESIGLLVYNHAFIEMKFSIAITESILLFVFIGLVSLIQIRFLNKRSVGD